MQKQQKSKPATSSSRVAHLKQQLNALACLVREKGYPYVKAIAAGIEKEYRCKPTDPGWQTYTTIRHAFEELFERTERAAGNAQALEARVNHGTSILAEIDKQNAK